MLFKQHQNLFQEYEATKEDNILKARELNELRSRLDQSELNVKNLEANVESGKVAAEEIRKRKEEAQTKASNQGAEERAALEQNYLRQIENLNRQAQDREEQLRRQLAEAQRLISSKEVSEDSLKYKLDRMKGEKNDEIERLKKGLAALKE